MARKNGVPSDKIFIYDGSKQSITSGAKPAFKQGDRVKVVDGKRLALLAN